MREALQLPVPEGLDEAGRLRFCWRNWRGGKALIAFDDVLDYDEIAPALPPEGGQFEVLLTSRQKPGPKFKRLDLDVLSPEAALELLEQLAGQERVTAEPEAAAHLCKWLGYLPLGVELAGRYLYWHEDLTVAGLQELLEQDGLAADILEQVEPEMTATRGVAKAFELSWEQLSEDGRELAAYLSLFAAAPIPWERVECRGWRGGARSGAGAGAPLAAAGAGAISIASAGAAIFTGEAAGVAEGGGAGGGFL